MSSKPTLPPIGATDEWLKSDVGAAAANMSSNAYLFPCHGITENLQCTCGKKDCSNAGKHPFSTHGVLDATNDLIKLAALFQYRTDLNLALATGDKSGVLIIDIDGHKEGWESLAKLENAYEPLPDSPTSITGNGEHRFFEVPKEKVKSRSNALGSEYPGIDVRTTGGYIIVPPSKHVSGNYYKWKEGTAEEMPKVPDWLLDLIKDRPKPIRPIDHDYSTGQLSEWSKDEVQRMLDCISPDITYSDWLNVGFALHEGGFPLSIWDQWSQKGSKYQAGDCERRWRGFNPSSGITIGTLVDMAKLHGWRPEPIERPIVDTSLVDSLVEKIQQGKIKEIPYFNLNFDPMKIEGLIGDTIRCIVAGSIRPQPVLALLNTLAFAGAVFGRRYASPIDTRTNIYVVGVADTGAGKDQSRKIIGKIAERANLGNFIGGNAIRSDTGMVRGLSNNSCQLLMLDEFGKFLQALTDKNGSPHHKAIIRVLMDLYSRSNAVYNHGDYANPKENEAIIIHCPNLCLYGTTTEKEYAKGMNRDAIESGELNRVLALKVPPVSPIRLPKIPDIEESLIDEWMQFSPTEASIGVLMNSPKIPPEPTVVTWGDCDDLQWSILEKQDEMGNNLQTKPLWNRRHENIVKIAMIFAISENKTYPRMKKKHFDMAVNIVDNAINYMSVLAAEHMTETPYEADQLRILSYLRKFRSWVPRNVLMTKMRSIKRRDREELINDLVERGEIEEFMEPLRVDGTKAGKKPVKYRIKQKAE